MFVYLLNILNLPLNCEIGRSFKKYGLTCGYLALLMAHQIHPPELVHPN